MRRKRESGRMDYCAQQIALINAFRMLWQQHVMWTRSFIISTAANLPDLNPVTQRLLRNPDDFARLLAVYYGSARAHEFAALFRDHLLIAAQLVNAAKAGNAAQAEQARANWYRNAQQIAAFLAGINPYWDRQAWQDMLFEHLRLTEMEAVERLTGQYAADIARYDVIEQQAMQMADMMATGILKQFSAA